VPEPLATRDTVCPLTPASRATSACDGAVRERDDGRAPADSSDFSEVTMAGIVGLTRIV